MVIADVFVEKRENGLIIFANQLVHSRPVAALNFSYQVLLAHVHAANHRLSFKYNTEVREKDIFFEMFLGCGFGSEYIMLKNILTRKDKWTCDRSRTKNGGDF